jgi:anti-sigma factor RsiW
MKCEYVRDCLSAYCAGELDTDEAAGIKLHLSQCAACEREHHRMAMVMNALADFETIEPSADFSTGVWNKIEAYEAGKRVFWLAALAGLLARNRRLVLTGCVVFAVSLLAGIYSLHNMGGGRPLEVARDKAAVSDAYVMREIPQGMELASDTVYTHFVTGDLPVRLTSQPETYMYRPAERSVSEEGMTF